MQELPAYETASAGAGPLAAGHCWVEELVDGSPLRFRVADSGLIAFGDADGALSDPVPLEYRCAVRTVRARLDRDAIRDAVPDPTTVTFVGVATHHRGTAYDWDRLPEFLGTAVHDAARDAFLPPDAARTVFERVGLAPVPIVDREVRAADVDPETYPIPESRWRDGPAAGVVFTNKRSGRAVLRRHGTASDGVEVDTASELVDRVVTDQWLRTVVETDGSEGVPVDDVVDRAIERLGRETRVAGEGGPVSEATLREPLARRVRQLSVR